MNTVHWVHIQPCVHVIMMTAERVNQLTFIVT